MVSSELGRTATAGAWSALVLAALAAGCARQERPDLAVRQSSAGATLREVDTTRQGKQYLTWDAATSTATFELVAGPFVFNGFGNGEATLTLPSKSNVVMNFIQDDGTPHSAEVASGEGPIPNSGGDPAIPRAYTRQMIAGLAQGETDVMRFTVPDSGRFRIICGVPGHPAAGMWIWMVIDPAAKEPAFGKTTP